MIIQEIYDKYHILRNLQEHQYRVAAVASFLCGHIKQAVKKEDVVNACLLHDMGNILKFPIESPNYLFQDALMPEGLQFWKQVKEKMREQYGSNEHLASVLIAKEIGVNNRVVELVDYVGFWNGEHNAASNDFEVKICAYADMRAAPFGVVSLEERFADLRKRYSGHIPDAPDPVDAFENALRKIEQQIFNLTDILPSDINDQVIGEIMAHLKNWQVG